MHLLKEVESIPDSRSRRKASQNQRFAARLKGCFVFPAQGAIVHSPVVDYRRKAVDAGKDVIHFKFKYIY